MNPPSGEPPERLLSAALRAQAVGGQTPASPPPPTPPPFRPSPPPPQRRPVFRVLLYAAGLGALAGAIIAIMQLL